MRELAVPYYGDPGAVEPSVAPVVASPGSEGGDPRGARPAVVAYRKACRPGGTGLSHYVLVADAAPRDDEPHITERP